MHIFTLFYSRTQPDFRAVPESDEPVPLTGLILYPRKTHFHEFGERVEQHRMADMDMPEPEHRMAAPRRFQRPHHNREQQYKRLARARAPEQKQIPDHPPDQLQRRLLVVRKFKACHKSKSFFIHKDIPQLRD